MKTRSWYEHCTYQVKTDSEKFNILQGTAHPLTSKDGANNRFRIVFFLCKKLVNVQSVAEY